MPVPQGWLFFSQSTFLLFHQPPLMADRLSTASATGKESDFSITRTAFISSRKRWPDLPRPRACACPHGHTSTGCRSQLFRLSHINRCIQASPALRGPEHYRAFNRARRPLKNRFARIDQIKQSLKSSGNMCGTWLCRKSDGDMHTRQADSMIDR
jgi:hypothetical protein